MACWLGMITQRLSDMTASVPLSFCGASSAVLARAQGPQPRTAAATSAGRSSGTARPAAAHGLARAVLIMWTGQPRRKAGRGHCRPAGRDLPQRLEYQAGYVPAWYVLITVS